MWDQSSWDNANKFNGGSLAGLAPCAKWTGTPAGPPPYSHFSDADLQRARPAPQLSEDDYASLKSAAQASGLYCQIPDSGSWNCTTPSGAFTPANGGVIQSVPGVGNNFVAYFDFPVSGDPFSSSRTVTWKAAVSPCSYDPALNRAVVIVVLYGSLDLTGQDEISGAFFVPEGQAWLRGSGSLVKIHGTTIAKRIDIGGNAQIMLDSCWVDNMPGSFLRATPFSWSEVDR
ncbi:MAG TPA: hypothetical protein VE975_05325 [Actinomycetota bacterium]|nr:hypothetical protein [Actinomycetota bacterium]